MEELEGGYGVCLEVLDAEMFVRCGKKWDIIKKKMGVDFLKCEKVLEIYLLSNLNNLDRS